MICCDFYIDNLCEAEQRWGIRQDAGRSRARQHSRAKSYCCGTRVVYFNDGNGWGGTVTDVLNDTLLGSNLRLQHSEDVAFG